MSGLSRGSSNPSNETIVFKPLRDRRGWTQVSEDSDDEDDNSTTITVSSGSSSNEKKKQPNKIKLWSKDLGNPMARFSAETGLSGFFGGTLQVQGVLPEKHTKRLAALGNHMIKRMESSMIRGRTRGGEVPVGTKLLVVLQTHAWSLFSFYAWCVGVLSIINGIDEELFMINAPYNWKHAYVCAMSVVFGLGIFLAWFRESLLAVTTRFTLLFWAVILILDSSLLAGYGGDSGVYQRMHRASNFIVALPAGWHMIELVTGAAVIRFLQNRESSSSSSTTDNDGIP